MYLPPNIIQEYRIEPIAPELPWFCLHPHLDILQGCRRLSLVVLVKQWIVDQLTPPEVGTCRRCSKYIFTLDLPPPGFNAAITHLSIMYLPPNIIQEYRIEPIAPELPWCCLHPHLDILQGCRRLSLVVLVKQWIVD